MAFDSKIRIRQMNQAELSGFLIPIVLEYLNNTGSLTGSFYPLIGNPSNFAVSGDFISQIDLDSAITQALSYVASQYATEIQLTNTGNYLLGLINASSAGVSSLNSLSGALSLTGKGNISVIQQGQGFAISGDTGIYSSFVTTGQTGAFGGNISGVVLLTGNQDISGNKFFYNEGGFPILDTSSGVGFSAGGESINWNERRLKNYSDTIRVDWGIGELQSAGDTSLSWNFHTLNFGGETGLNWMSKNLYGTWNSQGLRISGILEFNPILDSATRTLGNESVCIFTGTTTSDWTLPLISSCTGRQYTIKNRGSIVHLHSSGSDLIFTNTTGTFLRFVAGDACSLINDGQYWSVVSFSSGVYQPQFMDGAILDAAGDVLLDAAGNPVFGF